MEKKLFQLEKKVSQLAGETEEISIPQEYNSLFSREEEELIAGLNVNWDTVPDKKNPDTIIVLLFKNMTLDKEEFAGTFVEVDETMFLHITKNKLGKRVL